MRLLPPPWAGTHPAFPRTPEPLSANRQPQTAAVFGCVVGTLWAGLRSTIGRSYPGIFLNAIGVSTVALVGILGANEAAGEQIWKADIHAILKQDNVLIPRRKLYERTTQWCEDDFAALGAAVGLTSSLLFRRSRLWPNATIKFGWRRAIGGISCGWSAGFLVHRLCYFQQVQAATERANEELQEAEKLWEQRLMKPGPAMIYRRLETLEGQLQKTKDSSAGMQFPLPFHGDTSDAEGDQMLLKHAVIPQAPGTRPHNCFIVNGKPEYSATRDYRWQPDSPAEGVETLQDHIEDLQARRAKLRRQAEFLFYEVADRERQFHHRDKSVDNEKSRLQRKALELLSSTHSNLWVTISMYNWLIDDSQKMLLQLQSNGAWLPEKTGEPTAHTPNGLLEQIREHKKTAELKLEQLESVSETVIVSAEDYTQMANNIREAKENIKATSEVIEDFEKRNGSSGK
jgi:hypothetical protein